MSDLAVDAVGLGKRYRVGLLRSDYPTLRDQLGPFLRSPAAAMRQRRDTSWFWALREVTFQVNHGEVIGVIGRNGAGKSTLLKILSQITEPSEGYVDVTGRVGSLLEVGTGFHPELTGRENVLLNGAILGMTKAEISAKFDEIVAFAEIERFIDTPVKHYSSGMYVRLAFSVAAHMDPDILLVDEVLSVGDAAFQKKCLRQMEDVSNTGRTVVFVSHNLSTIQRLCTRTILLESGTIALDGQTTEAVDRYLNAGLEREGERVWSEADEAPHFPDRSVRLRAIRVLDRRGELRTQFDVKEPVYIEVDYEVVHAQHVLNLHLYFKNEMGDTIFVAMDNLDTPWRTERTPAGLHRARCEVPANLLNESFVRVDYLICTKPTTRDYVVYPDAVFFHIVDDMRPGGARGDWTREWPASVVRPRLNWAFEDSARLPIQSTAQADGVGGVESPDLAHR